MTAAGARPPVVAIAGYTVRACLPARRGLLVLPAVAGVLFGLLSRTVHDPAASAFARVGGTALHTLVLPIACLVIGDAVLGAEIRAGTFGFTWLSPVPFATIAAGRWLGGWAIASAVMAPAAALAAVAARAPSSVAPAVVAAAAGSAAYIALFVAVGATFKRPVVWSLAFILLVERLVGAALSGVAQLCPGWLAQAVLVGLTDTPADLHREGVPHGWAAAARLALVTAAALAVATRRLRHLRPAAAAD